MIRKELQAFLVSVNKYLVDFGQVLDFGPVKHPQGQANHLQVLGAGGGGDVAGLSAHIEDDTPLEPWNEEMGALADDGLLDTRQTVEDDSARTASHIVNGFAQQAEAKSGGNDERVDTAEDVWWERHGVSVSVSHVWRLRLSSIVQSLSTVRAGINRPIIKCKSSQLAGWSVQ